MFHRSREGCRGGRDQFNWDDIKRDRSKQNYLGNSIKASTYRGKDLFWYNKNQPSSTSTPNSASLAVQNELREQREREEKLLDFYLHKGLGAKPPEDFLTKTTTTTIASSLLKKPEEAISSSSTKTNDTIIHKKRRKRTEEEKRIRREEEERRGGDNHRDNKGRDKKDHRHVHREDDTQNRQSKRARQV